MTSILTYLALAIIFFALIHGNVQMIKKIEEQNKKNKK